MDIAPLALRLPPPPPAAAQHLFGPALYMAERYVDHLASTGVAHGLIGPREVPRLWERHVLNCAVLTDLLDEGAVVADVGSGAGLPGIVLAIRRPDVTITLVEPLLRRVTWLHRVVDDLRLPNVAVRRGRAQEMTATLTVDVVTARAVASLEHLVEWSFPLLAASGRLLALKGQSAADELARSAPVLQRGGLEAHLRVLADDILTEPTRVIVVQRVPDRVDSVEGMRSRRARRAPRSRPGGR